MPASGGDNRFVFWWRTRLIGFVLVAALGWSATTCADSVQVNRMGIQASGTEMPCPHSGAAMACCKSSASSREDQQSTAAKFSGTVVRAVCLVRLADPVPVVVIPVDRLVRHRDTSASRSPDTPTYLIDSVFLL